MSDFKDKYTSLLPLISRKLSQLSANNKKIQTQYQESLHFAVIDKIGPIVTLTDFSYSIQAVIMNQYSKSKLEDDIAKPFNRIKKPYYIVVNKSWIFLNCKGSSLTDTPKDMNQSHPSFYFKQNYQRFREQKKNMIFRYECQNINIKKWGLQIVNIGSTSAYGVILIIYEHRPSHHFIESLTKIYSILYEQEIVQNLRNLRLYDIKNEQNKKKLDASNKKFDNNLLDNTLFAYIKEDFLQRKKKEVKKFNNFMEVDKQQQILKYSNFHPISYITLGFYSGVCNFRFPLNRKQISQQKIEHANWQSIKILFNAIHLRNKKDEKRKKSSQLALWSDDDQSQNRAQINANNSEIESERESDDEDPLLNIYKKQLQKKKFF